MSVGNGFGDVPGDERCDVKVEAAVDDEGGEVELGERWGEVEGADGFG